MAYPWPGNVRELRNFIERMLIVHAGSCIDVEELPREMTQPGKGVSFTATTAADAETLFTANSFREARQQFETLYLARKFQECQGNISRLAEHIGLERSYLSRKLKAAGISQE